MEAVSEETDVFSEFPRVLELLDQLKDDSARPNTVTALGRKPMLASATSCRIHTTPTGILEKYQERPELLDAHLGNVLAVQ